MFHSEFEIQLDFLHFCFFQDILTHIICLPYLLCINLCYPGAHFYYPWVRRIRGSWDCFGQTCALTLRGNALQGHLEVITPVSGQNHAYTVPTTHTCWMRLGPEAIICPQCCDRQYVCLFRMMEVFPRGSSYLHMTGPGSGTLIRLLLFHCRVRGNLWIQMMSWTGADEMTWSLHHVLFAFAISKITLVEISMLQSMFSVQTNRQLIS